MVRTKVPNGMLVNPALSLLASPDLNGPVTATQALVAGGPTPGIYVRNTNERIRAATGTGWPGSLNLDSLDGQVMLAAKTTVALTVNTMYDGTAWQVMDTAQPSYLWNVGAGLTFYSSPAGATSAWTVKLTVSATGTISWPGGGYIADYGSSLVVINGLTVTPGMTYLAGITVNGNAQINGTSTVTSTETVNYLVSNTGMDCNGPLYFVHNGGIYWQWNASGYLWSSHSLLVGGAGIYFNSSAAYGMYWNGAGFRFTHYLMTDAGSVYFGSSGSYFLTLTQTNVMYTSGMNLLSGGWVGFSANSGINLSWDGTYIRSTHAFYTPGNLRFDGLFQGVGRGYVGNWDIGWAWNVGGNSITSGVLACQGRFYTNNYDAGWSNNLGGNMVCSGMIQTGSTEGLYILDSNCSLRRAGNRMHSYNYDGQWGYFRTTDGYSCGYIDTGGFHNPSTIKGKTDIRPLTNGLSLVRDERVTPITFAHRGVPENDQPDRPSLGFAAEDMEQVIPEVVGHDPETGEPASINYGALVAVLWDAVRTLNGRIDSLESQLAEAAAA